VNPDEQLRELMDRAVEAMSGEFWFTLEELSHVLGEPVSNLAVLVRWLQKPEYGAHNIISRTGHDQDGPVRQYKLVERLF